MSFTVTIPSFTSSGPRISANRAPSKEACFICRPRGLSSRFAKAATPPRRTCSASASALALAEQLRHGGVPAFANLEERSLGKQMKQAASLGVRFALILGQDEVKEGSVTVKNMDSGEQNKEPRAAVIERIKNGR